MFENPKYITRGVQGEIPDALMVLMWQMIAAMHCTKRLSASVYIDKNADRSAHCPQAGAAAVSV